jgi:hypothetical protein
LPFSQKQKENLSLVVAIWEEPESPGGLKAAFLSPNKRERVLANLSLVEWDKQDFYNTNILLITTSSSPL